MKFAITFVIIISFTFCLRTFAPESSDGFAKADTTDQNPNGSSELSVLMREMQQYTKQAKADLASGKKQAAYPKDFDKIHTAKITDGMSKSDFYTPFADLYIAAVKNYSTSKPAQRVETYNNMVSACLACHSQHCPGPVPAIKKMMWEVK